MTSKFILCICAFISISVSVSAQKSAVDYSKPQIRVSNGKTTVQPGEQIILKVKGINEEVASPQWQVSTDGINWADVPKANGNNLETSPLTQSKFFRVVTKANDGYLAIEEPSNAQFITVGDNVASFKSKRQ